MKSEKERTALLGRKKMAHADLSNMSQGAQARNNKGMIY
jgi:hypothetical protein